MINENLTVYVTTRWYRAPELLLNWENYNNSIDAWSIGCILVELITRKVLFKGNNTIEQLEIILSLIGCNSDFIKSKYLKSVNREKIDYLTHKLKDVKRTSFKEYLKDYKNITDDLIDLIEKLLQFDPDKRITMENALNHNFFSDLDLGLEINKFDSDIVYFKDNYDFLFECDKTLILEDYRRLILNEILLYHDDTLLEKYQQRKKLYYKKRNKCSTKVLIKEKNHLSPKKSTKHGRKLSF